MSKKELQAYAGWLVNIMEKKKLQNLQKVVKIGIRVMNKNIYGNIKVNFHASIKIENNGLILYF